MTNPAHIMGFLIQWKLYLDELTASRAKDGSGISFEGKKLDPTVFEKVCRPQRGLLTCPTHIYPQMSAEQIGQLYEVMHATKDVWRPVSDSDNDKQ